MKYLLLICLSVYLCGCAIEPPQKIGASIGMIQQIDRMSDWYLSCEREWNGDCGPFIEGRLWLKWNHGIRCPEISSRTKIFTGAPFHEKTENDSQAEMHNLDIACFIGKEWDL